MLDEDTGAEPRAVSASIADPFILIIRDDSSAFIANIDDSNELDELKKEDPTLATTKWLTGCLYTDTNAVFAEEATGKGAKPAQSILMFLLSANGALHVRPQLVSHLPGSHDANKRRYIVFLTYRSPYMLLKDSLIFPRASRPIMLQGREQRRRQ